MESTDNTRNTGLQRKAIENIIQYWDLDDLKSLNKVVTKFIHKKRKKDLSFVEPIISQKIIDMDKEYGGSSFTKELIECILHDSDLIE